jgi:hypothetical protein
MIPFEYFAKKLRTCLGAREYVKGNLDNKFLVSKYLISINFSVLGLEETREIETSARLAF